MATKPKAKPKGVPKGTRMPQAHGGTLVAGAGGGPQPGSGRPPDAFKQRCMDLASSAQDIVCDVLADPTDPAFMGALKWATEHGYGKPKESVEHSGTVTVKQEWSFGAKKVEF